jgi:two-component sensor histidine kinase
MTHVPCFCSDLGRADRPFGARNSQKTVLAFWCAKKNRRRTHCSRVAPNSRSQSEGMKPFVGRMVQFVDNLVERVFPKIRRQPRLAYPLATVIFVVAALFQALLSKWLPHSLPFLTFFIAVLLATLVAGTGPGLLVIAASLFHAWHFYFSVSPQYAGDAASVFALVLFALLAGLIVAIVHLLNRKVESLLDERARNEALLQDSALGELHLEQLNIELRHRLKNTFAVIGGLVSQSARFSHDIAGFASSLSGRLSAMGTAMDLVATRNFLGASLTELVADTLKPLVPPGASRFEIAGPEAIVPGDVASALGLTLHELGTNAIKYGAWSNELGQVSVRWMFDKLDEDEARLDLVWDEQGGPIVEAPDRRGLGTTLIDGGFPSAQVERSFVPGGVHCRIVAVIKQTTTRRTKRPRQSVKS